MANTPKYDTKNFSFGSGILYIAPYDTTNDKPAYPYIDIGAVKPGAVLRVNRDILDVSLGTPDTIVKSFVKSETVEFSIPSIEWKLDNLKLALGGGDLNDVLQKLKFGGSMDLDIYSLRFVHETPSGDIIQINIFKANPTGSLEINFGNDDVHQFELNFRGLKSNYGWNTYAETLTDSTAADGQFTATASNTPIMSNSLLIFIPNAQGGYNYYVDDGSGNIVDEGGNNVGTITYDSGDITLSGSAYDGQSYKVMYAVETPLLQTASIVGIEKISFA